MINPNTFIIGAQKAATTSLYSWMSQHPEICAPSSLKDYPFFLKKNHSSEETKAFNNEYIREGYGDQKIILQGYVNYMFYSESIANIHDFDSNAKLICVLRNPTDRAISAFNYFKKLNLEHSSLKEALLKEKERSLLGQREKNNFTYKAHGLYAEQLEYIFSTFNKNQVLILLYEDLIKQPEDTLIKVYNFLDIDNQFKAQIIKSNVTGEVKYKKLQNILFNQSKFKKFVVDNLIDPILPLHRRTNIKLSFLNWNTKVKSEIKRNKSIDDYAEEKKILKDFFKHDIEKLEKIINRNLGSWK